VKKQWEALAMDNNDQNINGKNKDHQEHKGKDEIPSWLEGLEEPDIQDDSSQVKENNQTEGQWVKETDEDITESTHQQEGEEQTKINPIQEQNVDDQDYQSKQDDFIEIPDLMTNNRDEELGKLEDEALSENEELPEWLHEMIAEEPEASLEEKTPSDITEEEAGIEQTISEKLIEEEKESDEPTEPMDITQETPVEQEEAFIETSTIPDQDEELALEPEIETPPISTPLEEQSPETPKTLRFAKFLLEQGNYNKAVDIINAFIDQPAFTEEIKAWLTDEVNDKAQSNSAVWEALGDIAMNEGDSEQAFNAYAKAVDILLSYKTQGNHETN
jgi:tetratricopeptide (TPR) repeat protein